MCIDENSLMQFSREIMLKSSILSLSYTEKCFPVRLFVQLQIENLKALLWQIICGMWQTAIGSVLISLFEQPYFHCIPSLMVSKKPKHCCKRLLSSTQNIYTKLLNLEIGHLETLITSSFIPQVQWCFWFLFHILLW